MHHSVGKAHWSTESGQTGRGAAHNPRPRGTPESWATGHSQVTRTGGKQQRPPGAATSDSAHKTQRTTAHKQVPGNTSCRPDGRVHTRQRTLPLPATERTRSGWTSACSAVYPAPCRLQNSHRPDGCVRAQRVLSPCLLRNAAVQMDECAPCSDAPHTQHSTPSAHTGEQEPSGPGLRTQNTCNATRRARTRLNRSQVAEDKAHAGQRAERAHR